MYTVEIYKVDRRIKPTDANPNQERLVSKNDYNTDNLSMLEHTVKHSIRPSKGERYEIHETYRTVVNKMSGELVEERYDTPYFCSVTSDAYWSM